MDATVTVQVGDERARIYAEGGIGYSRRVPGIGWILEDNPSPEMERRALDVAMGEAARRGDRIAFERAKAMYEGFCAEHGIPAYATYDAD